MGLSGSAAAGDGDWWPLRGFRSANSSHIVDGIIWTGEAARETPSIPEPADNALETYAGINERDSRLSQAIVSTLALNATG